MISLAHELFMFLTVNLLLVQSPLTEFYRRRSPGFPQVKTSDSNSNEQVKLLLTIELFSVSQNQPD